MSDIARSVIRACTYGTWHRHDDITIEARRNHEEHMPILVEFGGIPYEMTSDTARELGHQLMQYADYADGKVVEFTTLTPR